MKYLTAGFSAIIWGSGQFLNKQKLKGLIFFALQISLQYCGASIRYRYNPRPIAFFCQTHFGR